MNKRVDIESPVSAISPELTQPIVVGVDDGFAATKVVVMTGSRVTKQIVIPSRARPGLHGITRIGGGEGDVESRYETEGEGFTVENLGDSESARFDDYPFSAMNRVIVAHALRVAGLSGKDVQVATGLPLRMYYKGANPNAAVVSRKAESLLKPVSVLDGSAPANIVGHKVFPEGLAAWVDFAIDENGNIRDNLDETIGIIDIGGRTTDIAVVLPGRRIDHAKCGSTDLGVLNVIEEIISSLKEAEDVVITADKVEPALRTRTIRQFGKSVDIGKYVDQAALKVMGSISREVNKRLGGGADLDKILLVGGGAHVFRGITSKYPNIEIPAEPEFANARGFAKFLAM